MVKQKDIIKVNFSPQSGHEQAGFRPAVVVSNNDFINHTGLVIVCPITNTNNSFPLHIPLPAELKTTGFVLCEHLRTLDLKARDWKYVEKIDDNFFAEILKIIKLEF